ESRLDERSAPRRRVRRNAGREEARRRRFHARHRGRREARAGDREARCRGARSAVMRYAIAAAALLILIVIAAMMGKRHARRLQRERKIHVDRFKLKRRHALIELEVFGSRDVVEAVRDYAKS